MLRLEFSREHGLYRKCKKVDILLRSLVCESMRVHATHIACGQLSCVVHVLKVPLCVYVCRLRALFESIHVYVYTHTHAHEFTRLPVSRLRTYTSTQAFAHTSWTCIRMYTYSLVYMFVRNKCCSRATFLGDATYTILTSCIQLPQNVSKQVCTCV